MEEGRLLLSRQEAAAALGISIVTFDRMVKAGELRYVMVGKSRRFSLDELKRWIDDNLRREGESEIGGITE